MRQSSGKGLACRSRFTLSPEIASESLIVLADRPADPQLPVRSVHFSCLASIRGGRSILAVLPVLFFGCSPIGPNYSKPEIPTPDYWNETVRSDLKASSPDINSWWRRFNDSTLNKLISIAASQNRDLAVAAERIEEARAFEGVARGGLFPYAGAGGSITRNRSSETVSPVGTNPVDVYDGGINSGWEIDVVGGLRRSVEAAQGNVAATEEFYRDALVIILADVASSYIEYRTLQERIRVTQTNVDLQTESVKITGSRNEAGIAPEIDVTQAQTNLSSSKAQLPLLRAQLAQTRNRLAVLAGKYPGAVASMLGSGSIPKAGKKAAVGIPADLIRSRPDIRAAERQLAAQTAQIGVARAELYPKFTLIGDFGLQSLSSGDFLESDSRVYSFGPTFRWRIFEGGRIREQIKIEESRARQAYANYEQSVLQAVSEVETALSAIANERDRLTQLEDAVKASKRTSELITGLYTNDLVDFQNVLDAQRTVFTAEDSAVISRGQVARNHVALYRALGGSTEMPAPKGGMAGKP